MNFHVGSCCSKFNNNSFGITRFWIVKVLDLDNNVEYLVSIPRKSVLSIRVLRLNRALFTVLLPASFSGSVATKSGLMSKCYLMHENYLILLV